MSFEALYVGSTGLKSHGTRMQNIGNNLANVNTVGFKNANVHFETLMNEELGYGHSIESGISQKGMGVGLGAVLTDFRNGHFEDGNAATDLAIAGKGFFQVVSDDKTRYTRAGNFRFDNQGNLVDPNGYHVQGKPITDGTAGATGDVQLQVVDGNVTIDADPTTEITMVTNLGNAMGDNSTSAANPFFSMFENWNANNTNPLESGQVGYDSAIKMYDSEGTSHTVTVSFDEVNVSNAGGKSYFEYVVSTAPAEDGRAGITGTSGAGILMTGTMTFTSAGQIENLSAFTYSGTGDPKDLANWTTATLNDDGQPSVDMTFAATGSNAAGTASLGFNFGMTGTAWAGSGASFNAASVAHPATNLPQLDSPTRASMATTSLGESSATVFQSQDGNSDGTLMNVNVDSNGILVGNFSNGVDKELYQISIFNFTNEWGLRRDGSNHFTATDQSGEAIEGQAGTSNFGSIQQDSLESSNVDMADQFAKMIMNERGFQANSKMVTTQDQILQMLYQMKR